MEPDDLSARESLTRSRPPLLVVGYSQDPSSDRAVLIAAELAPALNARLVLVHVIGPADYPADPELRDWEARAAAELEAQSSHAKWLLSDTAVCWQYLTARGAPARVIAQQAHDLDALLIVVGAGQGRHTSRILHGSVSAELVRIQRRPVLVIPAPR